MVTAAIQRELESLADPGHAAILQRFFKTGPGEYGEGDRFRGLRVPVLRKLAKKYGDLPLAAAVSLLQSAFHEDRLLALLILIQRYYPGDPPSGAKFTASTWNTAVWSTIGTWWTPRPPTCWAITCGTALKIL